MKKQYDDNERANSYRISSKFYEDQTEENRRIKFKRGVAMSRVRLVTKTRSKVWWDTLYKTADYSNEFSEYVIKWNTGVMGNDTSISIDENSFDEYLWEDFTTNIDKYRNEIHSVLLEFGVCEVDAHFLSVRFTISMVKKFRGQFCKSFKVDESKDTYNRTFFRPCVILLIRRLESMSPKKTYLYSKKAAETREYRKQAAWECAKLLEEETSAIVTSKLLL